MNERTTEQTMRPIESTCSALDRAAITRAPEPLASLEIA
jgi:hypothetical protein